VIIAGTETKNKTKICHTKNCFSTADVGIFLNKEKNLKKLLVKPVSILFSNSAGDDKLGGDECVYNHALGLEMA
jgi:hypothetical protein